MAVLPLTDSMGVFSNPLLLASYSALLSIFSYVKVPVTIRFFLFYFSVYAGAFEAGVGFDLVSYSFFPM